MASHVNELPPIIGIVRCLAFWLNHSLSVRRGDYRKSGASKEEFTCVAMKIYLRFFQ